MPYIFREKQFLKRELERERERERDYMQNYSSFVLKSFDGTSFRTVISRTGPDKNVGGPAHQKTGFSDEVAYEARCTNNEDSDNIAFGCRHTHTSGQSHLSSTTI